MTEKWPSCKARQVLKALNKIGWVEQSSHATSGSHRQLVHPGYPQPYTWAFHAADEIGPVMMARIAKRMGLSRQNL